MLESNETLVKAVKIVFEKVIVRRLGKKAFFSSMECIVRYLPQKTRF